MGFGANETSRQIDVWHDETAVARRDNSDAMNGVHSTTTLRLVSAGRITHVHFMSLVCLG